MVRPNISREEFLTREGFPADRRILVLLPGSRAGEAARHMPDLLGAVRLLRQKHDLTVALCTPKGFGGKLVSEKFREPLAELSIKVLEDQTWNCIAYADAALAASGTVTVEAAILGTPMVTFYKVMPVSWYAGRRLVKVPFLSMVNLIAGRKIVPELMQQQMTPENLAGACAELLENGREAERMRVDLAAVRTALLPARDPFDIAAHCIAASIRAPQTATV
jgi:lipid-A-disaccharide synthase